MRCSICGGELNDSTQVCMSCGASSNNIKVCGNCGTKVFEYTNFCPNCHNVIMTDNEVNNISNAHFSDQVNINYPGNRAVNSTRRSNRKKSLHIGGILATVMLVLIGILFLKDKIPNKINMDIAKSLDSNVDTNQHIDTTSYSYMPNDSSYYKGMDYNATKTELLNSGFNNIEFLEIADLSSDSDMRDGAVEYVLVNEKDNFSKNERFNSDSVIIICYHIIPRYNIPMEKEQLETMEYVSMAKLLKDTGFINVATEEIYDIDPDVENVAYRNQLYINNELYNCDEQSIFYDSELKIVCHYPFNKYTYKVNFDFIPNIFFDKYNVRFNVDGIENGMLNHGVDGEYEIRLKEGEHALSLTKEDDTTIQFNWNINMDSDVDAKYKVNCYSNRVAIDTIYEDHAIKMEPDEFKIMSNAAGYYGTNYEDVIESFKNINANNIKAIPMYDIVFGITNTGSIEKISIAGTENFKRGDIFKKDSEIVIFYHMPYEMDPEVQAQQQEINKEIDDYIKEFEDEWASYDEESNNSPAKDNKENKTTEEVKYEFDKNLYVAYCEKNEKYKSRYDIIFAECNDKGDVKNLYTFDSSVNPRDMGKDFNVIGDLPSWFYIGALVRVRADMDKPNVFKYTKCLVTKVENTTASESTNNSDSVKLPNALTDKSLDSVIKVASTHGVNQLFDDMDFGHGTMQKSLGNDSWGLTMDIVYVSKTKEILSVQVVTNLAASKEEQNKFAIDIAKAIAPTGVENDISEWVNKNVRKESEKIFNNKTYKLSIGACDNVLLEAGIAEMEHWYIEND